MLRSVLPQQTIDLTRMQPLSHPRNAAATSRTGTATSFRRDRFITFDIVCSTHIDVVGKLESYGADLVAQSSGLTTSEVKQLLARKDLFCTPHHGPLVVLDFSAKADRIWEVLQGDPQGSVPLHGGIGLLPSRYVFDEYADFEELFLELCITRDELRHSLERLQHPIPPGTLLGIFTDWYDQFNPRGDVEFYGMQELWHPFLLHPYLDRNALDYLMNDIGVAGIATDAPTLEAPVYYCSGEIELTPNVIELSRAIRNGIHRRTIDLPPAPFVHIDVLSRERLLIESVDFERLFRPGETIASGNAILIPMLSDSTGWESIPVRALFLDTGRIESTNTKME